MDDPENIPDISWSDMFIHMITTPSAYTKEEMKVSFHIHGWLIHELYILRAGKVC